MIGRIKERVDLCDGHSLFRLSPLHDLVAGAHLAPRDLADDGADCTRRRRDHHGLASSGLTDLEQPHVGGHARHAEDAKRSRDRRARGIDLLEAGTIRQRMALPAGAAYHDIAPGEVRHVRGNHLARRAIVLGPIAPAFGDEGDDPAGTQNADAR